MGQSHRTLKVADRIKVVVANLLETKIKDPRLGFVTVTDARVTGDRRLAVNLVFALHLALNSLKMVCQRVLRL
jgi:ribosome-binding factor A